MSDVNPTNWNNVIQQLREGHREPHVVEVRASASWRSGELVLSRSAMGRVLDIDMSDRAYDDTKLYMINPLGGVIDVQLLGVNGKQNAVNPHSTRMTEFLVRCDLRLGFNAVMMQVPVDGRIQPLQPWLVARENPQRVAVAILPLVGEVSRTLFITHAQATINQLIDQYEAELARALTRVGQAAEAAALKAAVKMALVSAVLPKYIDIARLIFIIIIIIETNDCQEYNLRIGAYDCIVPPHDRERVCIMTLAGRMMCAIFGKQWGFSFNHLCPKIRAHLDEVGIRMGDQAALVEVPRGRIPLGERVAGVNRYFLIVKLPRAPFSTERFLAQWCDTLAVAPQLAQQRKAEMLALGNP